MGKLIGMRKSDLYRAEYASGKTLREIAAEYGVSYQAVHQGVTRQEPVVCACCIWPGLVCWMEENGVTIAILAKKLGVSWNTVHSWMSGKHEPRKSQIDAILELTGWSYEYLFAEE
jgi:transposase